MIIDPVIGTLLGTGIGFFCGFGKNYFAHRTEIKKPAEGSLW
jgi:hypothetical protein